MGDLIKDEVRDNYTEHKFHDIYDPNCSTCYSERPRNTHQDILKKHPALKDHDNHLRNEVEQHA